MGCAFCATARMGFVRNLSAAEITAQVDLARGLGLPPGNLVFMGMGEPLDNYDNLAAAIRRLVDSRARDGRPAEAFSARQMMVSTCGLVPGIDQLATLGLHKLGLAVSVNAPNDELRSQLMPVNRRHPLEELRAAIARFPLRQGIFQAEYVLLRGVNDTPRHARELADFLRPLRAYVNLIAFNPPEGATRFEPPTRAEVERFRGWLTEAGQFTRVRESKGASIAAGCGQLATPRIARAV
jgi:23S rRNA (adenine2503-C2)-methyltransferase